MSLASARLEPAGASVVLASAKPPGQAGAELPSHLSFAYRASWPAHLKDAALAPVSYGSLRQQQPGVAVCHKIAHALDQREGGPREPCGALISREASCLELGPLQPHCYYQDPSRRDQLRRVLASLAVWNPRLGYSPHFARLAAVVLRAVVHERVAFNVLVHLYSSWHLSEYYMKDRPGLCHDVQSVLASLRSLWREVLVPFERFGCEGLLHELVQGWLLTVLAGACNTADQPLAEFMPLLDCLFMAEHNSNDPRRMLRYCVVCIIGRYKKLFEDASSKSALLQTCRDMSQNVHVDRVLMSLIGANFSIENCEWFSGVMWTPAGMAVGWFGGLHLAASAVTATAAGTAGAHLVAAVCSLAGMYYAFQSGSMSAARLWGFAMSELLRIAENKEQQAGAGTYSP